MSGAAQHQPSKKPNDRVKRLKNGAVVVEARWGSILTAFFLDGTITLAIVALAGIATWFATGDPLVAFLAALAAWPLGAFAFGLTTANRRSPGQAAAGTQTIRFSDGSIPRFWRAGFVMLNRMVGMPFISVVLLLGALGGDAPVDGSSIHISIDVNETNALRASSH